MLRDWLELIRVPNVFTAMADVVMGFFFVVPVAAFDTRAAVALGLLIASSSLLYSAGMVLNDVSDYEEDCHERPARPLPSGRISRRAAEWAGWGLMCAGLLAGLGASLSRQQPLPLGAAAALALCVFLYDFVLKRGMLGPLALGVCRTLNVVLGMSAVHESLGGTSPRVAVAVGVYVIGISLMARSETSRTRRAVVVVGIILMVAALATVWGLPDWRPILVRAVAWRWIVVFMALLVAWRCMRAVVDPSPAVVQSVVGQSLRSLVVLDAVITAAVAGIVPGVAVLALLVPSVILSRRFYST